MTAKLLPLLFLLTASAQAGVVEDADCLLGDRPAASLLLPYFEVDLDNPEGPNTLIGIENISSRPRVARMTVWTDWAIPTISFDLAVQPGGIQSVNLRDVLQGEFPAIGGIDPNECVDPRLPTIDPERIRLLHTGRPDQSGLCWSSDRGTTSLAAGFVTIDALTGCAAVLEDPTAEGYFDVDGSELASHDNILSGDFFLVDPSENSAQSASLVHLPSDPDYLTDDKQTFYRRLAASGGQDARVPLSTIWRTRYLNGGIFDGGTDLLIWMQPFSPPEPTSCQFFFPSAIQPEITYTAFSENGETSSDFRWIAPAHSTRVQVGTDEFPVPAPFGSLYMPARFNCGICSPPIADPAQTYVMPIMTADGRFSTVRGALPLNDLCLQ